MMLHYMLLCYYHMNKQQLYQHDQLHTMLKLMNEHRQLDINKNDDDGNNEEIFSTE